MQTLTENYPNGRDHNRIAEIQKSRDGKTVVFVVETAMNARGVNRSQVRRHAVRWMATHPKDHRGVKSYRFDTRFLNNGMVRQYVKDSF